LICVKEKFLFSETTETCPDGQNVCFNQAHLIYPGKYKRTRGCAATCPKLQNRDVIFCCSTDKCNL
uniref:Muscarinic toxin-like protein 1 n=2 Tax=Naja TaxID=8638 RepID=3SUC1_NAJKA|nr:RecName: Full=Muscarinic toxin-like protein Tx-NM3-2 [Naja melanoleuca]P82462.1 RecName: Full=Muscarinic toxin-like protein 1; Short=MTLP-1 [Naja kaouthia]